MIPFAHYIKTAQGLVVDNSPAILTAIGVTGTVSTAVLAARATYEASADLHAMLAEQNGDFGALDVIEDIPFRERARLTWKHYIPPVAVGATTIACIVGANRISSKRAATLVTAYSITERAFAEYKDKVVEQIGVNKEQKVRDSIAQDRILADPVGSREVIITGNGKVLCYESYTARYFESDMETLRKAQNDINEQIHNEMYASLNDFNRLIGLPYAGLGEDLGWSTDKMLELQFSTSLSEDGRPCIVVGYRRLPFPGYRSLH